MASSKSVTNVQNHFIIGDEEGLIEVESGSVSIQFSPGDEEPQVEGAVPVKNGSTLSWVFGGEPTGNFQKQS